MEQLYELLQDYRTPFIIIKKGIIKSEKEWTKKWPNLQVISSCKNTDWFKPVSSKQIYTEEDMIDFAKHCFNISGETLNQWINHNNTTI